MVLHAQPADQPADAGPDGSVGVTPEPPEPAPASAVEFNVPAPYSSSGALRNPFPPIADYAFLSDWETTCLISPGRFGGVAVRAPAGLPECVRRDPGP